MTLVNKKDGMKRFRIDYRKFNTIAERDLYSLPQGDSTLDAIRGASWFSTLDLKSGYWQ